jgi:hypothetical protein
MIIPHPQNKISLSSSLSFFLSLPPLPLPFLSFPKAAKKNEKKKGRRTAGVLDEALDDPAAVLVRADVHHAPPQRERGERRRFWEDGGREGRGVK